MASLISKQSIAVGGINVNVYSQPNATDLITPVTVLFFLHGRFGSAADIEWVAESTLQWTAEQRKESEQQAQDLLVVTLDHRNHGSRTVDKHANNGWREVPPERNDRHATDMYSIHTGTARDISFLIDFLPSFLYPSGDRTVAQWLLAGKSLGGHTTWYALRHEPRVKFGIPIIACPDYIALMSKRAKHNSVPWEPPYVPDSLLSLIKQHDAVAAPYTADDPSNPFLGKKVLVLSGADDKLVPFSAGKHFVDNLNVGNGVKKVIVYPGVGHKCTPEMVQEMSKFIWKEALTA
ncbi:hypothetical protein AcV5_008882 [Taiwanofungus camphoratus]|nr:hypothetical protein AcV5_008882 [Antrodia cinnamomea]